MEYLKLDKKAITSWRIGRILGFIVLLLIWAGVVMWTQHAEYLQEYSTYIYAAAAAVLIYKFIGIIIYPLIEYRQWGYYMTDDRVDIKHGIFFITNTVIPVIRIQHISIKQGPINRRLGLHKVELSLASGTFTIEGLSYEIASQIAENLKSKLYVRLQEKEEGTI